MNSVSISDALFTKTQQRVLGLLYGNPHRSFYTNEVMRAAAMGRGTVRRELDRLVSAGLLCVSSMGNQRHYQANAESPVYTELLGLVRKTFAVADTLPASLRPLDDRMNTRSQLVIGGEILVSRKALRTRERYRLAG